MKYIQCKRRWNRCLISFLKLCFIFVVQLYEPLGVVLFVTPLFSMRKSFYTVSIPSWLFLCVHAVLDHISHLSGIMSQLGSNKCYTYVISQYCSQKVKYGPKRSFISNGGLGSTCHWTYKLIKESLIYLGGVCQGWIMNYINLQVNCMIWLRSRGFR